MIIWHSPAISASTFPLTSMCQVPFGYQVWDIQLSASALPRSPSASASASPHRDSNFPTSVTTHFFSLIRKYFQDEAKLASTNLSQFWFGIHLVSPIGSQQMANWAHVLGQAMGMGIRMLDGGRRGGVKLYHSSHITHSDSPTPTPRIMAICATIADDSVTLSGSWDLTT